MFLLGSGIKASSSEGFNGYEDFGTPDRVQVNLRLYCLNLSDPVSHFS